MRPQFDQQKHDALEKAEGQVPNESKEPEAPKSIGLRMEDLMALVKPFETKPDTAKMEHSQTNDLSEPNDYSYNESDSEPENQSE